MKPGSRYWKWLVLDHQKTGEHPKCLCVCDCGTFKMVFTQHLKNAQSKGCLSCGVVTHNMSNTPTLGSWKAMRTRCENPKHPKFHLYGGRGIVICKEWASFPQFLTDMGPRPDGHTLERNDSDGDYCKENCKWATDIEQNNNRSCNAIVEYEGIKYTIANLARHLDVSYRALYARIQNGKQLDAPYKKRRSPQ